MESSTVSHLVETLMERQQSDGQGDKEFARRLGITRQAWQLWKSGQTQPSARALRRVAENFRDLKPAVWDFIMSEAARK